MNVEVMIYIYLFVCTSMIVFNVVTALLFKRRSKKTIRISENFSSTVEEQLDLIQLGEPCDEEHKKYMYKKLKRIGNMLAFDKMLESAYIESPDNVKAYLTQLNNVFIDLSNDYQGKDRIETAYFPYIIKKYRLLSENSIPIIEENLFALLNEPGLYCRENAMQALYSTGNCNIVLKAITITDKNDLFFHSKILTDGLLNFSGNTEELINGIILQFNKFSTDMKVTLLNYIRFSSGNHKDFAYSILNDKKANDEIRYSAIRYLGKYKYDKAYNLLCDLAKDIDAEKWEYSAIASSALSVYPSDETIQILKDNLYSKNWYIRYNSANSLKHIGVKYTELSDIIDGNDRYASEILRYILEKN